MNILLVEDNKAHAYVLSCQLAEIFAEPETQTVETLQEACGILQTRCDDFDLVFLDLELPDSREWQKTCDAVASYYTRVPIIVMSGHDDGDIIKELLSRGVEDYIVKGGRKQGIEELKETIEFALHRHKNVKDLAETVEQDEKCIHWLTGGYSVE